MYTRKVRKKWKKSKSIKFHKKSMIKKGLKIQHQFKLFLNRLLSKSLKI